MEKIIVAGVLSLIVNLAIAAPKKIEVDCPRSVKDGAKDGWVTVKIDSPVLQKKPNLRTLVTKSRAMLVGDYGELKGLHIPLLQSEDSRLDNGDILINFNIRDTIEKPFDGIMYACRYKGTHDKYLVKAVSSNIVSCTILQKSYGEYSMHIDCILSE